MIQLRPYQVAALEAVHRELATHRSTLLVLATGLGKTLCFAELAREAAVRGRRTLVIAHREELIAQAVEKLAAIGITAGVEQGSRRAETENVVVASPATLRGARLEAFDADAFDFLVADEAHHANAKTWRGILDRFPRAKVLGVTATPHRADGQALGDVFSSVAYRYDLRDAIRDQWLVPIVARRVVIEDIDLSAVRTRAGDLAADELAALMEQERAVSGVVAPLLEQAGDRRTLVFAASVAHARALRAAINKRRPGAARVGHGEMSDAERKTLLADYRAGRFQFLCNVQLYTEGFDEPSVACVAIVRPTKSLALYTQIVGRGTRLADGKHDLLLLDFTGQAGRHRLVGPIDCLLGELLPHDDIRAEAERRLAEGAVDVEDAYRLARGDALVRWHAMEIDLFIGPDDRPPVEMMPEWETEAIPTHVLRKLKEAGVNPDRLPASFRLAHAYRLLTRLDFRKRVELCTLSQARRISVSGIETRTLSRQRATDMIIKLKAHGWRPHALHGEREYFESRRAREAMKVMEMECVA